jgi:hypothetical protein
MKTILATLVLSAALCAGSVFSGAPPGKQEHSAISKTAYDPVQASECAIAPQYDAGAVAFALEAAEHYAEPREREVYGPPMRFAVYRIPCGDTHQSGTRMAKAIPWRM